MACIQTFIVGNGIVMMIVDIEVREVYQEWTSQPMDLAALNRLVPKRAGAVDILVITLDDGGNMLTMEIHNDGSCCYKDGVMLPV